jgi:hypothetical protein
MNPESFSPVAASINPVSSTIITMNKALKAKLVKRLQNTIGRHGALINADGLKSVLIDVRDLLALVGESERFKVLKFHCDWILHPNVTGPRVQEIIRAVDVECVNSMRRHGLTEWPDSPGSDFIGSLSREFTEGLNNRFSFLPFETELIAFLGRHHIAGLPDPTSGMYRGIELLYCQLIQDRTWVYTNKKQPTQYINRAEVRMLKRNAANEVKPGEDIFPYALWWAFMWNEERRVLLELEFIAARAPRH